jgi:hypothetical protein
MSLVDDEIDLHLNEDVFTPESLSWKLLIDDSAISNGIMQAFIPESNRDNNSNTFYEESSQSNLSELLETEFEISLIIYMEMVFNWFKLLYLTDLETNHNDNIKSPDFIPDYSKITLSDLEEPFKEKFKKINYILHISQISADLHKELGKNSYCKILFRHLQSDAGFFHINKQIPSIKYYHFVLNGQYKSNSTTKLVHLYALAKINNLYFKISFNKSPSS